MWQANSLPWVPLQPRAPIFNVSVSVAVPGTPLILSTIFSCKMLCDVWVYSNFLSVTVIKHPDQKELRGRKGLFPLTGQDPSLREVRA